MNLIPVILSKGQSQRTISLLQCFLQDVGTPTLEVNPNNAAKCGWLELIRILRTKGIHCTYWGAVGAASNGHLQVVQDLRANGIIGTL